MIPVDKSASWRALIAFTTSNRARYTLRCLPQLARLTVGDPRLSLVLALDGDDADTREMCSQWSVPMVYSDEREGVGLSKNRVLTLYPDYDYYFFLEDDVEPTDGSVFARHVEMMQEADIHHMSLFTDARSYVPVSETRVAGGLICHYNYGGAQFNAFTRAGLERVGGWHPLFAEYRRWGHVEHSYRFPRNDLAPAPFNVIADLMDSCICHVPPAVTQWVGLASLEADGLSAPERALMDQELTHVPLQTLGAYHTNALTPGPLTTLASAFTGRGRYPLLDGSERRQAYADYYVWRAETTSRRSFRIGLFTLAFVLNPRGVPLRHAMKKRVYALHAGFLLTLLRRIRRLRSGSR